MIRIAAAGDIHFDRNSKARLSKHFEAMKEKADLFLLAGDLTQTGDPEEARVLAEELAGCPIPVVAVLGNHDFHSNRERELVHLLTASGVAVLEKNSVILKVGEMEVGIAGVKGFGGGFVGACGTEFGEMEMKEFVAHSKEQGKILESCLQALNADLKIALLHYSPIAETLSGESKELYPFLGSYYLAEAIDRGGANVAFHGHAHHGSERGQTAKGIPVRNVAQPVIRHAYNVYQFHVTGVKTPVLNAGFDSIAV